MFGSILQANTSLQSYALVSLTLPVIDNTDPDVVLGFMTVVASATSLIEVTQSREGLGNTGMVLLVGPNRRVSDFGKGRGSEYDQGYVVEAINLFADTDCNFRRKTYSKVVYVQRQQPRLKTPPL